MTRSQLFAVGLLVGVFLADLSNRIVGAVLFMVTLWAATGLADEVGNLSRRRTHTTIRGKRP